jgi:hypothetical protein
MGNADLQYNFGYGFKFGRPPSTHIIWQVFFYEDKINIPFFKNFFLL